MDSLEQLIDQELLNAIQAQLNQQPPPTTTDLPLDPLLSSIQHQPERSSTTTAVTPQPPPPPRLPRLPKSKLIQCAQLAIAAQQALDGVWEALQLANHSNDKLKISRNLDRQFGELHASATPFKQDALALIWPQCITNKSLKSAFNSHQSPAYFSIRRANIAFVAEYVLYAMPGEEAYGKNDIVFACEGFLPLVLDPELVLEPQSWKLFNELKVQIYIQRLDQSGQEEADSRVLPNLFVESLSSYSGLEVPPESEVEFDKLATETKQELIAAKADLELLQTNHPYNKFAIWALEFLHRCTSRLDQEVYDFEQLASSSQEPKPSRRKRGRQSDNQGPEPSSPAAVAAPALDPLSTASPQHSSTAQVVDISVAPNSEEEYNQDGEPGSKGYNPYRLGRGKGPTSAPRRRWTKEEYDLLLEEVRLHSNKYDCMAQIMKRHGRGGEISEILKDQNNVSLKDKARNLTMEWQRHGYPEDKPWLREAFARFSVKNLKRYNQRTAGGVSSVNGDGPAGGDEEGREEGLVQNGLDVECGGSEHQERVGSEGRRAKKSRANGLGQSDFLQLGAFDDSAAPAPDIGVHSIAFPAIEGFDNTLFDLEPLGSPLPHHHHHLLQLDDHPTYHHHPDEPIQVNQHLVPQQQQQHEAQQSHAQTLSAAHPNPPDPSHAPEGDKDTSAGGHPDPSSSSSSSSSALIHPLLALPSSSSSSASTAVPAVSAPSSMPPMSSTAADNDHVNHLALVAFLDSFKTASSSPHPLAPVPSVPTPTRAHPPAPAPPPPPAASHADHHAPISPTHTHGLGLSPLLVDPSLL